MCLLPPVLTPSFCGTVSSRGQKTITSPTGRNSSLFCTPTSLSQLGRSRIFLKIGFRWPHWPT